MKTRQEHVPSTCSVVNRIPRPSVSDREIVLGAIATVRLETIVRWHRAGFRAYWHRRSRNRVGRRKVSIELRMLIGEMSCANRLWGAPRISW